MPQQISLHYHALLSKYKRQAIADHRFLNQQLKYNKINYKKEIQPTLVQPGFLDISLVPEIEKLMLAFKSGIETIISIVLNHTESKKYPERLRRGIKEAFSLSDTGMEILSLDFSNKKKIEYPLMFRVDLYNRNRWQILEFNADVPGGIEAGLMVRIALGLGLMQAMKAEYHFFCQDVMEVYADGIVKAITPGSVCIMRNKDPDYDSSEYMSIKGLLDQKGLKTIVADPRELEFKNGKLWAGNEPIDAIHRRILFYDLVEMIEKHQCAGFYNALKASIELPIINSLSSALMSNKTIMAVLSDTKYHPLFEAVTRKAIKRHLPWTRLLTPSLNDLATITRYKDNYVLKKCQSYGGKDVLVGKSVGPDEWEAWLENILNEEKSRWIVQEYAHKEIDTYPIIDDHEKLQFVEMGVNINPFIVADKICGGIVRVAPKDVEIINLAKGAWLLPLIFFKKI